MNCSIVSPEYNQLYWPLMVRQLETKIILVKTSDMSYFYYKTQAKGRAQKTESSSPEIAATWFIPCISKMSFLFLQKKRAKWMMLLPCQRRMWSCIWWLKMTTVKTNDLFSSPWPQQGRRNNLPSRLVQGKETRHALGPLHRSLFLSDPSPEL